MFPFSLIRNNVFQILFQILWCVNGLQEKGFRKISGVFLQLCLNAALLKVDVGKSKVMIDEWEGEPASVVRDCGLYYVSLWRLRFT